MSSTYTSRQASYNVQNPYAPSSSNYDRRNSTTASGLKLPRIFKRIFKFPQMDFEVAVWEMISLFTAPKKVFMNVYYHKQTKNTYATHDPAFPYLLSFFLLLTSLAWSLAYAHASPANILRIAFFFVFVHCLLASLAVATVMYFAVPRLLGPRGLLAGRMLGRRRRGLFAAAEAGGVGEEGLEFGYCFDVAIRAFLPLWVVLYVLQYLLLPVVTSHRWLPAILSNTLYLIAMFHSTYISFLGYNALPFLSSTQLLLAPPLLLYTILWAIASGSGWNASTRLAPVLWCAGGLRKAVGGGAAAAASP